MIHPSCAQRNTARSVIEIAAACVTPKIHIALRDALAHNIVLNSFTRKKEKTTSGTTMADVTGAGRGKTITQYQWIGRLREIDRPYQSFQIASGDAFADAFLTS